VTIKPVINKINIRINRSRTKYAISLAKSLSPKDTTTVNKIWELCGFKSKEEFEKNFKTIYGTSFKDYISKL
jgi:transcriptional regulator GlxA family with amidase domain